MVITPKRRLSYKYRSGAAALRSLSDGCAYFAPPGTLNDALEAKFDIVDAEQFLQAAQAVVRKIASTRPGFAKKDLDKFRLQELAANESIEIERLQGSSQKVGIFSTATRPDSQPMWAYYCGDSAGVCFELEWPSALVQKNHLYPVQVLYTDQSRTHNRADDFAHLLLEISLQNPSWSLTQLAAFSMTRDFHARWRMQSIARAVGTKHLSWQHEEEIRILSPHYGPLPLLKSILRTVFFVRPDFPEWSPIVMLLRQAYPGVELAQITFSHREPFVEVRRMKEKLISITPEEDPWNLHDGN